MKKQLIPYAVVATLTFSTATITAQAIEPEEASEYFPAVVDWTETEWNSYLEENYGTNLDDYDTLSELETDLGPPIDLAALGNADLSDPNVLDIMERYDMSAEELIAFLDGLENVEDVYFLGDLENALNLEGFDPVDDTEEPATEEGTDQGAEEPATEEETDQGTEEPATEEETDQGTEEPATEEGTDQGAEEPATEEGTDQGAEEPATEEGTDQGTEEPATEEGQESEYAFDMSQLEEVYLTPLGWTEDEFSTYVEDNYDTPLTEFESFESLESTVGPVLNDERLQGILDSYGLTPEEYRQLLADYGEAPEDYNFVYELEEALDYYTSEEAENADTETGAEMPQTATDSLLMTLVGFGAAAAGALLLFRRRPEGEK